MGDPYRASPRLLSCPRCGEMLGAIVPGVSVCPRCEGLWLTNFTLDLAFGDPRWPASQGMWWQNKLACPECAVGGTTTIMDARSANGVHIDRCLPHGLWLDSGELGRVMATSGDELAALMHRIDKSIDPNYVAQRREQWRSDLASTAEEQRIRSAAIHALEQQHREREQQAAAEEQRRRSEVSNAAERRHREHGAYEARRQSALATITRLEAKREALRAELDRTTAELELARRALED